MSLTNHVLIAMTTNDKRSTYGRSHQVWLVAIFLGLVVGCDSDNQDNAGSNEPAQFVLTIDRGDGQGLPDQPATIILMDLPDEFTVWDLMQHAESDELITVDEFDGSGTEIFVKSINGLKNNLEDGRFWILYVNDEMATQGCGRTRIKPGDRVKWVYRASPF